MEIMYKGTVAYHTPTNIIYVTSLYRRMEDAEEMAEAFAEDMVLRGKRPSYIFRDVVKVYVY